MKISVRKGIVLFLLCLGISSCNYDQGLAKSVKKKDWDAAVFFLEKGADPDTTVKLSFGRKTTTLIHAAAKGQLEIVELALEKGADPEALDTWNQTALQKLGSGSTDIFIAEVLLDYGADVNAFYGQGSSPLSLAVRSGNLDLAKLYLDRGAVIDQPSGGNLRTPLQYAAESGHLALVEMLFEEGADINRQDKNGATALMLAAGSGKEHIVEYLLNAGADSSLADTDGLNFEDYRMLYIDAQWEESEEQ